MTAFVFEDADYFFPLTHYQVQGVLGYAALEALDSLTVTDNDTVYIQPNGIEPNGAQADKQAGGVRFYLDGDQVIVALGGAGVAIGGSPPEADRGDERMFAIDAGGQQTYLTSRYYDEHSADFAGQTMQLYTFRGLQATAPVAAYTAETVPLTVATTTIQFHFMPVLTQPLGSAALDDVYGLLGVDALDQLGSYTFDYRTMRFSVRLSEARD